MASPNETPADRPHATLLYHFFHPDDVVSARQFSDLAEGLVERGWDVTARPANRLCHDTATAGLASREQWRGVDIRRVRRPAFRQASNFGRSANTLWMLAAWTWAAAFGRRRPNEVVIIGTDPVLGVLAALPWRLFRPRAKIAHWCFDLYPDAAVAEGMLRRDAFTVRILRRLLSAAYRRCAFLADLGPCMARRLHDTEPSARCVTITPWALVEPDEPPPPELATRRELFGDASLGLLYSGSFGRAHSHAEFLAFARSLRGDAPGASESTVAFCFAGRGTRADELRAAVTPADANIRFAGFAPESQLAQRLAACDLHLVSLREDWTGTVVPSKFFGALAAGRGVVFAGSPDSSIARWIAEHQVGWVLTPDLLAAVAADLRALAANPAALQALRERCRRVYHEQFSKHRMLQRWDAELRRTLGEDAPAAGSSNAADGAPAKSAAALVMPNLLAVSPR